MKGIELWWNGPKWLSHEQTFQIPMMAPLTRERVQYSRPFTYTGVDFAGLLIIRSGIRGRSVGIVIRMFFLQERFI